MGDKTIVIGKTVIGVEPHTHAPLESKRYVATHTLWRYLPNGRIEVTNPGERCDWVAMAKTYIQIGWAVPV